MPFDLRSALAGKALGPHPAFMGADPVSVYSPGASRQQAMLSQRNAGHHMQAYGGKEAIDWVYDAIGLYADPISVAPYRLKKQDGTKLVRSKTKGTPPDHKVGPKALYELLDKPNPYMLYDELMSLLVIDLMLVGNAYWFKWRTTSDGKPLAIYRLAPAHVKIVPAAFGPAKYEYQPPGAKKPLKIEPEEIIHFRRPNPHDAYYGMGVIQGAGRAMDLELAVTDTMASYYENKADPSLIVQSERRVPRDVFNKLRAQLMARASGSNKAGALLVLEAGLKASTLSRSAADSLFEQLSTMSRDRILAKFRVPPMLLGLGGQTSTGLIADVRREFDNSAVRPYMDKLQKLVSAQLTAAWGIDFEIDYRYQMTPDEAVKVAGELAAAPGIKVREVRRQYAVLGIEESTGDPEIDEFVLNMPGPEADANGQVVDPVTGQKVNVADANSADRPLPGEAGRPPKGENTRGFGVAGKKALSVDEVLEQIEALARAEGKALAPDGARVTVGNKLPGEKRPADPTFDARAAELDSLTEFIQSGLTDAAHLLERDLLDHVEGKAFTPKTLAKRIRNSEAWTSFRDRVNAVLEEAARRAASAAAMHWGEMGRLPENEIDYDAIAKTVVHRPEGLRGIVKTLKDRVLHRVTEQVQAGVEKPDVDAAVREVIFQWHQNQAGTIAISEAVEAYNEGALTIAEEMGDTQVFVEDGRETDEPCIEADGSVWDIAYARQHRKEHPHCVRAFLPLSDIA